MPHGFALINAPRSPPDEVFAVKEKEGGSCGARAGESRCQSKRSLCWTATSQITRTGQRRGVHFVSAFVRSCHVCYRTSIVAPIEEWPPFWFFFKRNVLDRDRTLTTSVLHFPQGWGYHKQAIA